MDEYIQRNKIGILSKRMKDLDVKEKNVLKIREENVGQFSVTKGWSRIS